MFLVMSDTLSTKDKILDLASIILQERGYNGFSYSHIAKQLGIRNAAIHYHFPAKADLGAAMIQRYQDQFDSWVNHNEQKFDNQHEKLLDAYTAIPRSFINRQHTVCPLAVLEANYTVFPDQMQLLTQSLSKQIRAWLRVILDSGRRAGVFTFDGLAEDKALIISAALQGASMMAHVESVLLFESTVQQIKRELGLNHE